MSVRVTSSEGLSALYDSTSGLAFGPVFDSPELAEGFLRHLTLIGERDARTIPALDLAALAAEYVAEGEEDDDDGLSDPDEYARRMSR